MTRTELESLVKKLVKQSLTEALAEKFLEKIIKEAVQQSISSLDLPVLKESRQQHSPAPQARVSRPAPQPTLKEEKIQKLGIKDPVLQEIFKDTLQSNNPILTGDETATPQISEDTLEKMGVYSKNWDKFI